MASQLQKSNTVRYVPKKDSLDPSNSLAVPPPVTPGTDAGYLFQQARWIRDILDPQVAQGGPDALSSDDVLSTVELLRKVQDADISFEDVRFSRMHLAVSAISGCATRWPARLVERCDTIVKTWEQKYGRPLKSFGTPLYEPGGRLRGICAPEDLSREKLLIKWMRGGAKLSPSVSRKKGDLGFVPGDWWLSSLFAHRAGIIDFSHNNGGIVSDSKGAYAVVLTGSDEVSGANPDKFQYHAREKDPGRYRLVMATAESRHPIRILRSHTLHSFWKPKAGLRYDGLHKVTGWSIQKDPRGTEVIYIVNFQRLASEISMDSVLRRPWTDEVEDYAEHKRIRDEEREKQRAKEDRKPTPTMTVDGAFEIYEDETAQAPFQNEFTNRLPESPKGTTTVTLAELPSNVQL